MTTEGQLGGGADPCRRQRIESVNAFREKMCPCFIRKVRIPQIYQRSMFYVCFLNSPCRMPMSKVGQGIERASPHTPEPSVKHQGQRHSVAPSSCRPAFWNPPTASGEGPGCTNVPSIWSPGRVWPCYQISLPTPGSLGVLGGRADLGNNRTNDKALTEAPVTSWSPSSPWPG